MDTTSRCTIYVFAVLFAVNLCSSQAINHKITDTNGREKLLGVVNKEGFMTSPFKTWFSAAYTNYSVDRGALKSIKKKMAQYHIKVFMGTWCGDSKREIPRFYKILDAMDFPQQQLQMIAVDNMKPNYKKSPGGEEKGLNLIKVPTFIFYKNGKEINRIVESPVATLEKDIAAIVLGNGYVPHYSTVLVLPQD